MYKINIEYGDESIDHIFIRVLKKEIRDYFKNMKDEKISSYIDLSKEDKKND